MDRHEYEMQNCQHRLRWEARHDYEQWLAELEQRETPLAPEDELPL